MKLLTNQTDREEALLRLRELLASRGEWFCAEARSSAANLRASSQVRASFSLRAGEWDLSARGGALRFACWTDAGARAWRVEGWAWSGGKLTLRVSRRMGAE